MKKSWDEINRLLSRKPKSSIHPTKTKDPENNLEMKKDPSKISNILNKHFSSVGGKLDSRLPSSSQDFGSFL